MHLSSSSMWNCYLNGSLDEPTGDKVRLGVFLEDGTNRIMYIMGTSQSTGSASELCSDNGGSVSENLWITTLDRSND